jgi:N utilization substance protein B
MNNEINNELNEIEVNDAETSDIFEEEVNLTRSESREQAFMLLFSKSFDDEPLEETIDDNSEMFVGGVCAYAQAVVSGIEDKHEEIDEPPEKGLDSFKNFKAVACYSSPCNL